MPFDGIPPAQMKQNIIAGERPEIPLSCPKPLANLMKVMEETTRVFDPWPLRLAKFLEDPLRFRTDDE